MMPGESSSPGMVAGVPDRMASVFTSSLVMRDRMSLGKEPETESGSRGTATYFLSVEVTSPLSKRSASTGSRPFEIFSLAGQLSLDAKPSWMGAKNPTGPLGPRCTYTDHCTLGL